MAPLAVAFPWKPGPYQEAMPVWLIRPSEAGDGGNLTLDGGREQATRNNNGGRKIGGERVSATYQTIDVVVLLGYANTDRRIIAEAEEKRKKKSTCNQVSLHSTLALYKVLVYDSDNNSPTC